MCCEHFHFLPLIFSRQAKFEQIEYMVQLHNFFFFITFMVVPCGMSALVLLKWFINRDVPTCAFSSMVLSLFYLSFGLFTFQKIHMPCRRESKNWSLQGTSARTWIFL